jgi:hypothetical protein
MPRIQREPAAVEEHFIPCAEIHRRWVNRHADVAKVTGAVPRRDVHASGQGHRQVSEVPANAAALLVSLRGRTITSRVMIAEFDAVVSLPAARYTISFKKRGAWSSPERCLQVALSSSISLLTAEIDSPTFSTTL